MFKTQIRSERLRASLFLMPRNPFAIVYIFSTIVNQFYNGIKGKLFEQLVVSDEIKRK